MTPNLPKKSLQSNVASSTRAQLFSVPTEEEKEQAIRANMAYNESMAQQNQKEYPTPLSLLDTAFGIDLVKAIFGRIDAGVYS